MPTFRYVVCDVFTDPPLDGQPARGLHGRARDPRGARCSRSRGRWNFSETVFVLPGRERRPRRASGSSRRRPSSRSPGTRRSARPSCSAAPLQLTRSSSRRAPAPCPVGSSGTAPRIVFGRMEQPIPTVEAVRRRDALLAALGVERSELPVELYDNGAAHVYVALAPRGEVAALEPDFARLAAARRVDGVNCFAGDGQRWKTRMFAPGARHRRGSGHRLGRGPARACHLARHGADRVRRGDRDRAGRRDRPAVDALRARRRARRSGSSASRSAAPRSSSRAASSGCRQVWPPAYIGG